MGLLISARALQGLGAGGNFALVNIVLSEISTPEKRGKMLSLASLVWGVASVLGPPIGGFIVNYFSWRWIFFINIPLGGVSVLGIYFYFEETRLKQKDASVDIFGLLTMSVAILGLLTAFLLAVEGNRWLSPQIIALYALTAAAGIAFYHVEKGAKEPILPIGFFTVRGFRTGNGAAFFCSFAIFSLVAYVPLFIQGAMGKTPAQLGLAMIFFSLAWSGGALLCGQMVNRIGHKLSALLGALSLSAGSGMALSFSSSTPLSACVVMLILAGLGMGFVSIATLLVVQNSLQTKDLGVATTSQQFARSLGGTLGVGISGSLVSARISEAVAAFLDSNTGMGLPLELVGRIRKNIENLFLPGAQSLLPEAALASLQEALGQGVMVVFFVSLTAAFICLIFCWMLPGKTGNYSA